MTFYNTPESIIRAFVLSWLSYKAKGVTGESFELEHGQLQSIPANRRVVVSVRIEDIAEPEPDFNAG